MIKMNMKKKIVGSLVKGEIKGILEDRKSLCKGSGLNQELSSQEIRKKL